MVRIPLTLDLRAHARQELVRIDQAHDIVVHAHIEAAEQTPLLALPDDNHDGQMPRAVERSHLRAEPQAISVLQAEAHDHEVEIAVGHLEQRTRRVGSPLHMLLGFERSNNAFCGALAIFN